MVKWMVLLMTTKMDVGPIVNGHFFIMNMSITIENYGLK